ncbi:hypothetical protein [Chitinophaga nivalis]|uniref:Uncharacterized protein n=1 Tax=Chitinophaga nivalis TaxID=2991709 RepID=A0ABT3IH23_9BACT|nr:hypothetical protein [Chitinophaga nivalis]MCW3467068.1 hypothetical protein [Chitinophaga nivalis]MCW3483241.1 hypothetical protein [Chitinophaga nivalis]
MRSILIILLLVNSMACVTVHNKRHAAAVLTLQDSYCKPPGTVVAASVPISGNADTILAANNDLRSRFSVPGILMLHALGLTADIHRLLRLQADTDLASRVQVLEIKTHVNSQLLGAMADINATAAELDCEGERVDQVVSYIDSRNAARNNKLVVASIALGAAAAIAGALISNDDLNKGVAIGAGGIGAGLGLATLNPKGKKMAFYHHRNLLRAVWTGKVDSCFSPFIGYMLTEKHFSNSGTASLLQNLKKRWIAYQFEGDEQQGAQSVIFTDGGIYRSDDLHARAAMTNQLQAVIRAVSQQLHDLLLEMNNITTAH